MKQYIGDIIKDKANKIHLLENNTDVYDDIATRMVNTLKENNSKGTETIFILPVGPRGQYKRFTQICNNENISCNDLITINMDEFLDDNNNYYSESSAFSFRGFMKNDFFNLLDNKVKMRPENMLFPDPSDPAKLYKLLVEFNGADICFVGVGINGHIAFNEPIDEKLITVDEFKNLKSQVSHG